MPATSWRRRRRSRPSALCRPGLLLCLLAPLPQPCLLTFLSQPVLTHACGCRAPAAAVHRPPRHPGKPTAVQQVGAGAM